MDRHLIPEPRANVPASTHDPAVGGVPSWISSSGRRVDPQRIDLALAAVVEQQAQIVLAGAFLAATYPDLSLPAARSCSCSGDATAPPPYLSCELGLLTQVVRLALAAGVTLPAGFPTTFPQSMTTPVGFAAARQSCHRDTLAVLGRLSFADEVAAGTRDAAHELMRDLQEHGRPVEAPEAAEEIEPPPVRQGFLPGELLG